MAFDIQRDETRLSRFSGGDGRDQRPADRLDRHRARAQGVAADLVQDARNGEPRGRIERVLARATVAGHRSGGNPARWTGHLEELLPAKTKVAAVQPHNAVPYREMAAFMAQLRAKHGVSARAFEFTILTAARTGETIGAKWSEIDLNGGVWTVPAERMKVGQEHRVPLSDRAIAVLKALPRDGGERVFAREGKSLSDMAMLQLLRSMRTGPTVYGFRSSFRDWAGNETNTPRELVEQALAHSIGDKAEQASSPTNAKTTSPLQDTDSIDHPTL